MPLKLYVWENVLTDYTDGLICVLADSEAQARQLLEIKDSTAADQIAGITPEVIEKPAVFLVWGGG